MKDIFSQKEEAGWASTLPTKMGLVLLATSLLIAVNPATQLAPQSDISSLPNRIPAGIPVGTDLAAGIPSYHISNNDNRRDISPLTPSQIIFLNTVSNVQQPGVQMSRNMFNLPGNQTPRITAQNLREIDWSQVDRRTEEGERKPFIQLNIKFWNILHV